MSRKTSLAKMNPRPENIQKVPVAQTQKERRTVSRHAIYLIGGEQGGVGKSFVTRILLEFFIRKGWDSQFTLMEDSLRIEDVGQIFKGSCKPIIFSNSKYEDAQPDRIFSESLEKTVVVNLPGNIDRPFNSWMATSGVLETSGKESFGPIYYLFVSDGCFQSINHFIKHIERYQSKNLAHILVLNPGRLTCSGTFHYLEEYEPLMEMIKTYQIPVLLCPELIPHLQFWCDQHYFTFEVALEKQEIIYKGVLGKFLTEVDEFWGQLFGDNIDELSKLAALITTQKAQRDKKQLPISEKTYSLF